VGVEKKVLFSIELLEMVDFKHDFTGQKIEFWGSKFLFIFNQIYENIFPSPNSYVLL